MKEKKKVQTENQERIKTPFSEMVRKFKKQKNAVVALCFIIFLKYSFKQVDWFCICFIS